MSRDGRGKYQRGTSGNPGGLPAYVRSVRLLAGQKAPRALTRLAEMMEDPDVRVALPACLAILDRAGVRPVDVHVNLGNRDPVLNVLDESPELDVAELEQLAKPPAQEVRGPASQDAVPDDAGASA
jgi:hypothetical protein